MKINYLEANQLLDQYEKLLTSRQALILNDYYRNDLSLQEIANNENISKAAINDLINRGLKQLLHYEDKLKLVKKNKLLNKIYAQYYALGLPEINELLGKIKYIEEE